MRTVLAAVGLLIGLAGFSGNADAAPITYEIASTASGQIGNTIFTNAAVRFTGTADTANIVPEFGGMAYANPFLSLTVTIGGIGTASLTEPAHIFGLPAAVNAPPLPALPLIIFGRTDHPPALDSFTGMGAVATNQLAGYDLSTSIGPITGEGGIGFIEDCGIGFQDPCLQTTLGLLSFTTNILTTAGATFTATVTPVPVPEPATLFLVGGGLGALVRRTRRARRAE